MAQNNGTSSGQVARPVRRFSQTMCLYTDAKLSVSTRKWPCRICYKVAFYRPVDLDRHIRLIHLPCSVFCPYPPCGWRGCRVDDLQKHLDQYGCKQNSADRDYQIYKVEIILDMIRNAEGNEAIENAQNWAVHFVQEKARELGRHGWTVDPWGCLEQRERRERHI